MVTSHPSGPLLVLVVCFSLLSLPSDGATVYGLPRHLDYETHLQDPLQEGGVFWGVGSEQQPQQQPQQQQQREGENSIYSTNNVLSSSSSSTNSRDLGRPPQALMPERYVLVSPEDKFLRELLLHSAPPPSETRPITNQRLGDVTSYASPEDLDRLEIKLPSLDPARLNNWGQQQQQQPLHLYTKQKRLSQPTQMQQKQRYMSLVGLKVAEKRWWGGHHRRGQIDRRASQNKHLDCLKSCIKQGTLHPIQCHTLC